MSQPRSEDIEFPLSADFVELCNLLKLVGVADSGGQGKVLVANGEVSVDGAPELRKKAKIRAGQVVECFGVRIHVRAAPEGGDTSGL